jgi:hypothetical protein
VADNENFNDKIIKEFRENDGKVGGMFEGAPVLLQKELAPGFAEYETNAAPRQIPVILLDPVA